MKTIRISRSGFPNHGMHSWMKFFIFTLTKKYNVIVDPINPDIVICSNIYNSSDQLDTFTNHLPVSYDNNRKFLFVSGEQADFANGLDEPNKWSIGYQNFTHPHYLRQPSGIFDVWTLFDESRVTDTPFNWLSEKRNYEKIKNRNVGFCSITQASHNDFREIIFNKLCEYKNVTSSGPWKQNINYENGGLNKYQWHNSLYGGRIDGLTYREKIEFFKKYKFNIAIHYTDTPYILQEKIFHAYFSGAIPIFYGNDQILFDNFNPNSFINLHDYKDNLDEFLNLVKEIDNNVELYKKYIEEPIYIDNKLPEYMDFDYTLDFLNKIIES
jgi:hypothetical protein